MWVHHVAKDTAGWVAGGQDEGWRRGVTTDRRETELLTCLNTVLFPLAGWYLLRHLCFRFLIITYQVEGKFGNKSNSLEQVSLGLLDYMSLYLSAP